MDIDCIHLPYRQTNAFSDLVYDYIDRKEQLLPFYKYPVGQQYVADIIAERTAKSIDRHTLVASLQTQYSALPDTEIALKQIQSLVVDTTFTVCTAHQPNLLSGYLYFFYKILHAIKTADELNQAYPQYHFVPVYYMGSEDNDLDELGRFFYENKHYVWDADNQSGAVGRMQTKSLQPLLQELFKKLGPPGIHLEALKQLIEEAYLQHNTVAAATQYFVHRMFGMYGLLVLNPDDASLKRLFVDVMENDLFEHEPWPIAREQSVRLSDLYKAQAYPRQINLFYLKDQLRERIEREGGHWQVLNTGIRFTAEELKAELTAHPERFSPNVILRGLFQERILPNVCFIGGGSELAYWLQLKPLFERFDIQYPMLLLRQSVQIVPEEARQLMEKLGLENEQLFASEENWIKERVLSKKGNRWSLHQEQADWEKSWSEMVAKAAGIDPTLEASAKASVAKMRKQLEVLEQKMYRAVKRKEKVDIDRFVRMKEIMHIRKGLQERKENFMPYYLSYGFDIFDKIYQHIRAFEQQFMLVKTTDI